MKLTRRQATNYLIAQRFYKARSDAPAAPNCTLYTFTSPRKERLIRAHVWIETDPQGVSGHMSILIRSTPR